VLAAPASGRPGRRCHLHLHRSDPLGRPAAQLAFQLSDLGADRGLCDVNALGGAGEIGLLSHGDEVFELPKFHNE